MIDLDWTTRTADAPFQILTEKVEERATLTLTQWGSVLGCPRDAKADETAMATQRIRDWLGSTGTEVLVLPWPVDVEDLTK